MMARRHLRAALALMIAGGVLLQAQIAHAETWSRAAAPTAPLTSSLSTSQGTWALLPMEGFWELFLLGTGGTAWTLQTPPGVADNGGLVVSGGAPGSLVAGFRPSQSLKFSPLATTQDAGGTWTPGIFPSALAAAPDALAAASDQKLLALSQGSGGAVWGRQTPGGNWSRIMTLSMAAHTTALRACDPGALTAVAFAAGGTPLVGAECRRPGAVGVVALIGDRPTPAGPALPGSLRSDAVSVLRLTSTPDGAAALLLARAGSRSTLLGAWESAGAPWSLSSPLPIGGASIASTLIGPGLSFGVVLDEAGSHRMAEVIQGPGSSWQRLPPLPAPATLVAPTGGGEVDALGSHGAKFHTWRLAPASDAWAPGQTLKVPIQAGSST